VHHARRFRKNLESSERRLVFAQREAHQDLREVGVKPPPPPRGGASFDLIFLGSAGGSKREITLELGEKKYSGGPSYITISRKGSFKNDKPVKRKMVVPIHQ